MELTPTAVPDNDKVLEAVRLTPASCDETELNWKDPGPLLEKYRAYLLIIANEVIGPELQAKVARRTLFRTPSYGHNSTSAPFVAGPTLSCAPGSARSWNAAWRTSSARCWPPRSGREPARCRSTR